MRPFPKSRKTKAPNFLNHIRNVRSHRHTQKRPTFQDPEKFLEQDIQLSARNDLLELIDRKNLPLIMHKIFTGCCDMSQMISLQQKQLSPGMKISYTETIADAKDCMRSTKEECKRKEPVCKLTKNNNCILNPEGNKKNEITFPIDKMKKVQFLFNSRYNGELIKLIKVIPFKIIFYDNEKDKLNDFKKYYDLISKGTGTHIYSTYYITIYEVNDIRCVCFPAGEILNPDYICHKLHDDKFLTLQEMIPYIFEKRCYHLICGHSMGGAFSQYLCSLYWEKLEYLKQKCYLITCGAFNCLNKTQKESVLQNFKGRFWSYCYAMNLVESDNTQADNLSYNIDSYTTKTIVRVNHNKIDNIESIEPILLHHKQVYSYENSIFNILKEEFQVGTVLPILPDIYQYELSGIKYDAPQNPYRAIELHKWEAYRKCFMYIIKNKKDYYRTYVQNNKKTV